MVSWKTAGLAGGWILAISFQLFSSLPLLQWI
jgi:hypothetical protein